MDFYWKRYIYETDISPTCQPGENFPRHITVVIGTRFFSHLKQLKSSPGNNDFLEVIENKLLHGMDKSTNSLATIRVVSCWKILSFLWPL